MGRTGTIGRRALLAAGAATLAACSAPAAGGPKAPSAAERAARAELALRRGAVASSAGLLERYDATLAAHPALATRLTPLRTSAASHVKALGEGLPEAGANNSGKAAAKQADQGAESAQKPSAASSARVSAPVAADPATAVRDLATAARRTSDAHAAALLDAPPEYARLLASVAAAAAAHAYLLTAPDPARSTR